PCRPSAPPPSPTATSTPSSPTSAISTGPRTAAAKPSVISGPWRRGPSDGSSASACSFSSCVGSVRPSRRRAVPPEERWAEREVVGAFSLCAVAAVGLTVLYWKGGQPQLEGVLLAVAFGTLGY